MEKEWKEFAKFLLYLLLVCLFTYGTIKYVGQRTVVEGTSMEPALSNGDHLIVEKLTYRFTSPKRFDIIIFPYQHKEDTFYIKRIIGLPKETVKIDEKGIIYINGEELIESYGKEVIQNAGMAANEITLGEDEYFVLGDNRNNSSDSRYEDVGKIKRSDVKGRAWMRIYPFDKIGSVLP